jgi:tricorn protease
MLWQIVKYLPGIRVVYIYFTASTDYGMNVGWLDMSSYDHPVTSSIYMAVLSKETKSPLASK